MSQIDGRSARWSNRGGGCAVLVIAAILLGSFIIIWGSVVGMLQGYFWWGLAGTVAAILLLATVGLFIYSSDDRSMGIMLVTAFVVAVLLGVLWPHASRDARVIVVIGATVASLGGCTILIAKRIAGR